MATFSLDTILVVLNRGLKADPDAMMQLVSTRIVCNDVLASDPTIQCGQTGDCAPTIGVLGLLNGVLGIDPTTHFGPIQAVFHGDTLVRFERSSRYKQCT